jgi:hypothetical protein
VQLRWETAWYGITSVYFLHEIQIVAVIRAKQTALLSWFTSGTDFSYKGLILCGERRPNLETDLHLTPISKSNIRLFPFPCIILRSYRRVVRFKVKLNSRLSGLPCHEAWTWIQTFRKTVLPPSTVLKMEGARNRDIYLHSCENFKSCTRSNYLSNICFQITNTLRYLESPSCSLDRMWSGCQIHCTPATYENNVDVSVRNQSWIM